MVLKRRERLGLGARTWADWLWEEDDGDDHDDDDDDLCACVCVWVCMCLRAWTHAHAFFIRSDGRGGLSEEGRQGCTELAPDGLITSPSAWDVVLETLRCARWHSVYTQAPGGVPSCPQCSLLVGWPPAAGGPPAWLGGVGGRLHEARVL